MTRLSRIFIIAAASLLAAGASFSATFVVPTDREMVQRADVIVVASAMSSHAQLARGGWIETVTQMSVEEVIKGSMLMGSVEVHEPGGELNGNAFVIPGAPRFVPGQRLILFLTRTPENTLAVTDLVLGKFRFTSDVAGRQVVVRDEGEINGWDPDGSVHREPHRSAEGFVQFLRGEARGSVFTKTDYMVPSEALVQDAPRRMQSQSDRTGLLAATATYSGRTYTTDLGGGNGSRWTVFPTAVNWYTGPTAEPGAPGGGVTAAQAALASWDNDPCSNVNYVYAGTDTTHTSGLSAPDGRNTIQFERNLATYGVPPFVCTGNSYSGTLGIGGITSASGTNVLNGETYYTTQEGDVEMNQGIANCTLLFQNGDFNTAVTHEVGHTLGFRHSDQTRANNPGVPCSSDPSLECSTQAVMKSFVPSGINGALQPWDQHAVQAVYPAQCQTPPPPTTKRIIDFNADAHGDVFWHNYANGQNSIWFLNGTSMNGVFTTQVADTNWVPAIFGDFNGDHATDVLWRNTATGETSIWLMNGATVATAVRSQTVSDLNWVPRGMGDFDGNGTEDIFWQNTSTGQTSIWFMNGTTFNGVFSTTVPPAWVPVAFGDLDGDGKDDIFWRNSQTGETSGWLMNGATFSNSARFITVSDLNWTVVGAGDFNGDGRQDIFWRNQSTGQNSIWFMNGLSAPNTQFSQSAPAPWVPRSFSDYDANNTTDIFWWNPNTGETSVWLMSGANFSNAVRLQTIADTNWRPIQSH